MSLHRSPVSRPVRIVHARVGPPSSPPARFSAAADAPAALPQHLDSSPNQYIQWRYGIGEDREALEKVNLKVSEEEQKKMAEKQARALDP